jgi:hypothetical protein
MILFVEESFQEDFSGSWAGQLSISIFFRAKIAAGGFLKMAVGLIFRTRKQLQTIQTPGRQNKYFEISAYTESTDSSLKDSSHDPSF